MNTMLLAEILKFVRNELTTSVNMEYFNLLARFTFNHFLKIINLVNVFALRAMEYVQLFLEKLSVKTKKMMNLLTILLVVDLLY